MTGPHINVLPGKGQPREAALGSLTEEATIDSATDQLVAGGIKREQIYFLSGDEGIAVIEQSKTIFSIFDDSVEPVLAALREGNTVVGVFEVDEEHADKVEDLLRDAGVADVHYFGKWTHS